MKPALDKKALKKEIAAELRKKDRARLAELRAQIREARAQKRESLKGISAGCRFARKEARARAREARRAFARELKARLAQELQAARAQCQAARSGAREAGFKGLSEARSVLEAERAYQKELRAAERRIRKDRPRLKRGELRAESDDDVRQNIPAELVSVFDKIRTSIKSHPRKSRTEVFLEWAESHPDAIYVIQQAEADAWLKKTVAEEYELGRAIKAPKRYRRSTSAMAAELAEAPF